MTKLSGDNPPEDKEERKKTKIKKIIKIRDQVRENFTDLDNEDIGYESFLEKFDDFIVTEIYEVVEEDHKKLEEKNKFVHGAKKFYELYK